MNGNGGNITMFPIDIFGVKTYPAKSAQNLQEFFTKNFNVWSHISVICSACFDHIQDLRCIRRYLDLNGAKLLANVLVSCGTASSILLLSTDLDVAPLSLATPGILALQKFDWLIDNNAGVLKEVSFLISALHVHVTPISIHATVNLLLSSWQFWSHVSVTCRCYTIQCSPRVLIMVLEEQKVRKEAFNLISVFNVHIIIL